MERRTARATVAEAIVEELRQAGVERIYGMPGGGSNMLLIDAASRAGLAFVLAHHETAAIFMAAGEAEVTGRPGACLATVGPGVGNSINGLAHCKLDCVPLLLITDRADDPQYLHQAIDHAQLVTAAVKRSERVSAESARSAVRGALADAVAPPPGALHLDLSPSVARQEAGDPPLEQARAEAQPDPARIAEGVRLLRRSSRPVVLAGVGARDADCVSVVRAFAERLQVPVLATYKAKGILPENHPLAAGLVTNGALEGRVLSQADALLAVGFDAAELMPGPWKWPLPTVTVGHEATPNRLPGAEVTIAAAPAASLEALEASLQGWQASWPEVPPSAWLESDGLLGGVDGVAPAAVVAATRAAAPTDTIATVDAGSHMFAASLFWKTERPRRFLISNSLATMGYGLPAAIGASLACPDDPVVCFTGDGGLAMVAGELATAARLGARVVVVVFGDATLNLIKIKQERQRGTTVGLDFDPVDWATVASGFGVTGLRATTVAELERALRHAVGSQGPALIDVKVDATTYPSLLAAVRG